MLALLGAPRLANAEAGQRQLDAATPNDREPKTIKSAQAGSGHLDAAVSLIGPRGPMCSGVLIHPLVILTARHCRAARWVAFGVDARRPDLVRKLRNWRTPRNAALDVALARIDPVEVTPYPLDTAAPDNGRRVRVVGFGTLGPDRMASGGHRSYFEAILNGAACDQQRAIATGCMPGLELTLPRSAGADSCSGDSGGPVLTLDGHSWRTLAITSRSVARPILPCGDGGIYVRADAIARWVTQELGNVESEERIK